MDLTLGHSQIRRQDSPGAQLSRTHFFLAHIIFLSTDSDSVSRSRDKTIFVIRSG